MCVEKHILLVEDNPIAVQAERLMLKQVGCQVDLAKDGDEAVAMAIKNRYDGIYGYRFTNDIGGRGLPSNSKI